MNALSDLHLSLIHIWLVIECSVNPGETFLDRMIAMVEGAQRRKTCLLYTSFTLTEDSTAFAKTFVLTKNGQEDSDKYASMDAAVSVSLVRCV